MKREIFKYSDGTRDVFADPMDIIRGMSKATGGKRAELLKQTNDGSTDAEDTFANAIRQVFSLPAIDPATGAGVLWDQVWAVWGSFVEFCDQKKTPQDSPLHFAPGMDSILASPTMPINPPIITG